MKSIFFILTLFIAYYAQLNLDVNIDIDEFNSSIIFPFINEFNALSKKYQHVVILTIDDFHQVSFFLDEDNTNRLDNIS